MCVCVCVRVCLCACVCLFHIKSMTPSVSVYKEAVK